MTPLQCEITCHSNSPHLQQLYTGFNLLEKQGYLRLQRHISKESIYDEQRKPHLRDVRHAHLLVRLENGLHIFYDTHDSYEIEEKMLARVDFYFKRSFLPSAISDERVKPLGLNYPVTPDDFDLPRLYRTLLLDRGARRWMSIARQVLHREHTYFSKSQALPEFGQDPRVIFMVGSWDPAEAPSAEKAEERQAINNMRAQCIRSLKSNLKEKFLGGFPHTVHAVRNYPDCLLPDPDLYRKPNFMRAMKEHPICIATSGLHASTGWKMAEYVAHSKAIISEKLTYQLPGDFRSGENYLEFSTPDECAEQAEILIRDKSLRHKLIINNYGYYRNYVRPDNLVANSLITALGTANGIC